jgi:hypothetical protein
MHYTLAMANSVEDRIRARVEQFAAELAELIRESAMETVSAALVGARPSPGRGGRRAAPVAVVRGGGRGRAASREKGAKRPPDEIERLTGRLLDYVKGNPGQRIEQIADGMGTSTKELNLPAKKLISGKQLKTKGQKRATQYFSR